MSTERAGYAAAQGGVHDKVQRMDIGQLIANHLTLDHALEVLLHPLSGDALLEQRIVLLGS